MEDVLVAMQLVGLVLCGFVLGALAVIRESLRHPEGIAYLQRKRDEAIARQRARG